MEHGNDTLAQLHEPPPAPAERVPFHGLLDSAFLIGSTFTERPIVTLAGDAPLQAVAALHRARLHRLRELLAYLLDRTTDGDDGLLDLVFPPVDEALRLAEVIHERLKAETRHG